MKHKNKAMHGLVIFALFFSVLALSAPALAGCDSACDTSTQYSCSRSTSSMTKGSSGSLEVAITNKQSQSQSVSARLVNKGWFTATTDTVSGNTYTQNSPQTVTFTITPTSSGSQDVCVLMGSTCQADCTAITITAPASLGIASLSPSTTSPSASSSFTVSATLQNSGTESATDVTATLSSSACTVSGGTRSVGTVSGSTTSSVSWAVTAPSSGSCTLSLSVSSTTGGSPSSSTSVTVSSATTTTTSSSTGTGGGGASGTVQAGTKVTVTKGKATVTIPSVAAGKSALVEITKTEETNVRKIAIVVKNAVKNIEVVIEKPAAKPAEVTTPSEKVYHYLTVAKTNLTDSDVSSATIDFQVEKAWMNANNIDSATVALNRYSNGWSKLTTTKLSEDATYAYYSAQSPGLSVFAVTASEKGAATTTIPGVTTTVPPGVTTTVPGTAPVQPDLTALLGFVGLVVIVIVGAVYYHKKKPGYSYKS